MPHRPLPERMAYSPGRLSCFRRSRPYSAGEAVWRGQTSKTKGSSGMFVKSPAITEGSLTTGMGEALGLSLLVVVIDDLDFHVSGAFGDFRNAPQDLDHNLSLGHRIRRGGLKPHPLPCQTTCSRTDEENSASLMHIYKTHVFSRGEARGSSARRLILRV